MLGKLIKHEFLADVRLLGPAYLVTLLLSLFTRLATWLATRQAIADAVSVSFEHVLQGVASILSIVFIIAVIASVVLTLFFMIYRFYKNFFTDEGYLMMTLPARSSALIFSKFINAVFWLIISMAVAVLSIVIVFSQFDELKDTINQIVDTFQLVLAMNGTGIEANLGTDTKTFLVEMCFYLVFWFSRFAFMCYFAIAFGQLLSKNHKIGGAIVAYIIETICISILSSLYLAAENALLPNFIADYATNTGAATQTTVLGGIILNIIISAVLYWLVSRIMTRHLNLD